ncbi:MAG: imidazole glycerol phosphate synthase subunit HisH [Pseudomonadota bacterium]
MQKLVVVDYGMGNLRSVAKAFEFAAHEWNIPTQVVISGIPADIDTADRIVFPGQGAMPDCMRYLQESGLERAVRDAAATKPFFGVCVGMQMLFDRSEEGNTPGLGIFGGIVKRFSPTEPSLKVPHMGWNEVFFNAENANVGAAFQGISSGERFYYVHSYFCAPTDSSIIAASTSYIEHFTAAVGRANIFATQFHPEKSHHAGLMVYKNFLKANL